MPVAKLEALEAWVVGLQPDLTLFFDVPVAVGQRRLQAGAPDGLDRFEREAAQFHERVRAAYLERAARYPARIRVIDSSQPISDIRKELEQIVRII